MATAFEGHRITRTVLAIVVLTAVLPTAAAKALATWRITRAGELARIGADRLASHRGDLSSSDSRLHVMCGPGRRPRAASDAEGWLHETVRAPESLQRDWPQDPWGRCYLLNTPAWFREGAGLLISAGPNGTIETPIHAAAPGGDDIGAVVR